MAVRSHVSERLMSVPSAASRAMIERLIRFNTVSRDSNLGLIEWVRDYLVGLGANNAADS